MSKIALVTGGTSGLGLQSVRDLVSANYKVYSLSRNEDTIKQLKKELPEVVYVCGDVSDMSMLKNASETIEQNEGKLDVLINNAAFDNMTEILKKNSEDFSFIPFEELKNDFRLAVLRKSFMDVLSENGEFQTDIEEQYKLFKKYAFTGMNLMANAYANKQLDV